MRDKEIGLLPWWLFSLCHSFLHLKFLLSGLLESRECDVQVNAQGGEIHQHHSTSALSLLTHGAALSAIGDEIFSVGGIISA